MKYLYRMAVLFNMTTVLIIVVGKPFGPTQCLVGLLGSWLAIAFVWDGAK